ncbi:MAG: hypothetical protein PHU78_00765, partial [Heliobacteriaceae bacterium]|nr:hypothetical protein [Heliobacteriaceae bacterium]
IPTELIFKPVAERWFRRAGGETDPRDRFLAYWTAFQALYGPTPELKEGEKILWTVNRLSEAQVRMILVMPEVQFLANMSPLRYHDGRTGQLKTTEHQQYRLLQRAESEPRVALEALVQILQKVRLNIFSSGPAAVRDEQVINNAVPVVRGMVELLIQPT